MLRLVLLGLLGLFGHFAPAACSGSELLDGMVGSDGVINVDAKSLQSIFAHPRNFTLALLLSSESQRIDCPFCKVLGPDFRTVAGMYNAQTGLSGDERELYFVYADLDTNMAAFKALELTHVPNLVFYPPAVSKGDVKKGLLAEHSFTTFVSTGPQVDHLLSVIQRFGYHISKSAEFQWQKLGKAVGTLLLASGIAYILRSTLIKVYQSKKIWLAVSLLSIIMFTSGYMYNVMRNTKFMGASNGAYVLVEPSFSSQFAAETQIVAVLYAILAFTTIGLIKYVTTLETAQAQAVAAAIGSVVLIVVYSVLISTFKIKNGGYPISLLPINVF